MSGISMSTLFSVLSDKGASVILDPTTKYGVRFEGDIKSLEPSLFDVLKAWTINGSLATWLRENPDWKAHAVPSRRTRKPAAETKVPAPETKLPIGETKPPDPEPKAAAPETPVPAPVPAAPAPPPPPAEKAPESVAAPEPPAPTPSAVAPSAPRAVVRVGIRSEGPGREYTKDPWVPTAQCWPCSMVYHIVDRAVDPQPDHCWHCGGRLVGMDAKKPEDLKPTLCWISKGEYERSKAKTLKDLNDFNARAKDDVTMVYSCKLPCHHEGEHEWSSPSSIKIAVGGSGA